MTGWIVRFIWVYTRPLNELEESRGVFDVTKMDAEVLHFQEEIFDIDSFIAHQWLDEHTDQTNESILHIFVFSFFTRFDTRRDVSMEKFLWEFHQRRQTIDHFHRTYAHLHFHQLTEVIVDLIGRDQFQKTLNTNRWTAFHQ